MGAYKSPKDDNFIGLDWLPYRNNPFFDNDHEKGWTADTPWIHSLRGDWKEEYWDKTANQAFHFWFYVAVTFFDGAATAAAGNMYHELVQSHWGYDQFDYLNSTENEPPPATGKSEPDYKLGVKGIELGENLHTLWVYQPVPCDSATYFPWKRFDLAAWIRSNLKE